jgi:hypothetical protein
MRKGHVCASRARKPSSNSRFSEITIMEKQCTSPPMPMATLTRRLHPVPASCLFRCHCPRDLAIHYRLLEGSPSPSSSAAWRIIDSISSFDHPASSQIPALNLVQTYCYRYSANPMPRVHPSPPPRSRSSPCGQAKHWDDNETL